MGQDISWGPIEQVARRPDAVALAGIVVAVLAAWAYLAGAPGMSSEMAGMDDMGMAMASPAQSPWAARELLGLFVMWAVMMVAMMLPSAAPMILLFSRIGAARGARGEDRVPVGFFAGGYLAAWWAFSAVAAGIQYQLHSSAALSADMRAVSPVAGAVVLLAAGLYQWLPLKQICLTHCRTPLGFLSTSWREGRRGAVTMGLHHGAFCVGCCWLLMSILFVAGVMNLVWVLVISCVVLLEKTVPAGQAVARSAGLLLIGAGVAQLL